MCERLSSQDAWRYCGRQSGRRFQAVLERTFRVEVPTAALLAYAAAIEDAAAKGRAFLVETEPNLVKKLGLLPTPALFGAAGAAAARRVVRKDLDLVRSLHALQPRTRDTLAA